MTSPTTCPIGIRGITPADAPVAARLSAELGYPVDDGAMRARIEGLLASPDHCVLVAEQHCMVIGWIHASIVQHMQSDPRAEIGGLVVASDARGGGVGARLVAAAEAWAVARGLRTIVVRSQIMREDAHRFYLREGYARTKTSAVFSKPLPGHPT
jgi:GNAT superfamily N-acetyltransferase